LGKIEENKERSRQYYQENKVELYKKQKEYILKNKEAKSEWQKQYRAENKEKSKEYQRLYVIENKEKLKEQKKIYYIENKQEIRKAQQATKKNRRKADPAFKIRELISKRMNEAIKKNGSFKNKISCLIGLGIDYPKKVKEHIEALFEPWMTWENQGSYNKQFWIDDDPTTWSWQIDHIISHLYFHYTSPDDLECRKAWALSNLRPLCAKQNILDKDRPTDTELHKSTMAKILEELGLSDKK
jgi:actin-related protein